MINGEFAAWQAMTESSTCFWMEDEIYRLNGRGAMYYIGGTDGAYMRIQKDGMFEAGTFEGAIPHIGEAMFKPIVEKNYDTYSDAFIAAMKLGGKKFLADVFSGHQEEANKAAQQAFKKTGEQRTEAKCITADEVRTMTDREGLVLQGCGGDLNEWIHGINEMLTKEGILQSGSQFTEVYAFDHDGMTNLLLGMDNVNLDTSKLAMWRLKTHETFGGTWLSDYLPNRLGISPDRYEQTNKTTKPNCPIIGADGNIFNIMGIAGRTLKECGMSEKAGEMRARVQSSGSYDNALAVIMEYVNPIGVDNQDMDMQMGGML